MNSKNRDDEINEDDYQYPADHIREEALRKHNYDKYLFWMEKRLADMLPKDTHMAVRHTNLKLSFKTP